MRFRTERPKHSFSEVANQKPESVSYTHLDVYKRQALRRQVRAWQKAADRDDAEPGGLEVAIGELNNCLLYTSRCV